jgi:hypothetical protein
MFNIDYLAYHGSLRKEALENVLLIGRGHVEEIFEKYLAFYKSQRPHEGIQQQTPRLGESERTEGGVMDAKLPPYETFRHKQHDIQEHSE